jgi:uncharacterized protein (TIGR03792 family)
MRLQIHEPPMAIEQLVFHVEPEHLQCWLELDHQIWTRGLAQWPGFAGKQVWINQDEPGEITMVIYWTRYEHWQAIDPDWVVRTDAAFQQALGDIHCTLVKKGEKKERFFKICECAPPR